MNALRYLSVKEVIAINVALIQKYSPGEHIGVKSGNLIEPAVLRSQPSTFGNDTYPTIFEKSAALFESLGKNHPFQNANKRTAFTALVIFLKFNGYRFVMDQKLAEDMTVDMVNHHYTVHELTALIRNHCEPLSK